MATTQITKDGVTKDIHDHRLPSTLGTAGQVLQMNQTADSIVWGTSAGGSGIVISDTPPADPSITTWVDTSSQNDFDPAYAQLLVQEHNESANAHLITDSVTSKKYRIVIANGVLGIEEVTTE